jgi:hypothetical protein
MLDELYLAFKFTTSEREAKRCRYASHCVGLNSNEMYSSNNIFYFWATGDYQDITRRFPSEPLKIERVRIKGQRLRKPRQKDRIVWIDDCQFLALGVTWMVTTSGSVFKPSIARKLISIDTSEEIIFTHPLPKELLNLTHDEKGLRTEKMIHTVAPRRGDSTSAKFDLTLWPKSVPLFWYASLVDEGNFAHLHFRESCGRSVAHVMLLSYRK